MDPRPHCCAHPAVKTSRGPAFGAGLALALVAGATLAGCAEAPVTGRQQLILVDEAQANQLGDQAWQQIKAEKKPAAEASDLQARVERIGKEMIAASGAQGLEWEFQVFDDPTPNAFALPGGKIGVHSGMARASGAGGRPPEFLSTHPDPQSRIVAIRGALPEVMPVYRANS